MSRAVAATPGEPLDEALADLPPLFDVVDISPSAPPENPPTVGATRRAMVSTARGAVAAEAASRERAKAPAFPGFTQSHCRELYEQWQLHIGAVEYPRFRKALGPVYDLAAQTAPAGEEAPVDALRLKDLDEAFRVCLDHAPRGPGLRFFNPEFLASKLVAIARMRVRLAHDPELRFDRTAELLHGRTPNSSKAG